jgi:hypothetical protein
MEPIEPDFDIFGLELHTFDYFWTDCSAQVIRNAGNFVEAHFVLEPRTFDSFAAEYSALGLHIFDSSAAERSVLVFLSFGCFQAEYLDSPRVAAFGAE